MRIKSIRLEHLKIPLLIPFTNTNNRTNYSNSLLVVVETMEGTLGYGEACPKPQETGESIAAVSKDIWAAQSQLFNRYFNEIEDIKTLVCEELSIGNTAICGLELAILDAWSKETGHYLVPTLKGKTRGALTYSGIIPINETEISKYLQKEFDFSSVKIKVGKDLAENRKKIAQLQFNFDEELSIRIDAQNAWTLADAMTQIPVLKEMGVKSFERLFPKSKENHYRQIMQAFGEEVAIVADTALTNFEEAKHLIKVKICNTFQLSITKLGGIFRTLQIYELAQREGITCQLGANFGETSILTAAGIIFESLATKLKYMEGASGTLLLEVDISERSLQMNREGVLQLPLFGLGKGLGLDINEDLVDNYKNHLSTIHEPKSSSGPVMDLFKLVKWQVRFGLW